MLKKVVRRDSLMTGKKPVVVLLLLIFASLWYFGFFDIPDRPVVVSDALPDHGNNHRNSPFSAVQKPKKRTISMSFVSSMAPVWQHTNEALLFGAEKYIPELKKTFTVTTKERLNRQVRDLVLYTKDTTVDLTWIIVMPSTDPTFEFGISRYLEFIHPNCSYYFRFRNNEIAERWPRLRNPFCPFKILFAVHEISPESVDGAGEKKFGLSWIKSSNSWVYFLDEDNSVHPDFFQITADKISQNPNVDTLLFENKDEFDGKQFLMKKSTLTSFDLDVTKPFNNFIGNIYDVMKTKDTSLVISDYITTRERLKWGISEKVSKFISPSVLDYTTLYKQYGHELKALYPTWVAFCSQGKNPKWSHTYFCLTGTMESELLYLRLRHLKPRKVLEISSAYGFSTLVMRQALDANRGGNLFSVDVYETPIVSESIYKFTHSTWTFVRGDMTQTLPAILEGNQFDYLHIDTCHDAPCIQWYIDNVLEGGIEFDTERLFVSLHDIYDCRENFTEPSDPYQGLSNEGVQDIEWLSSKASLFIENPHAFCPGLFFPSSYAEIMASRAEHAGGLEEIIQDASAVSWKWWFRATLYLEILNTKRNFVRSL